MRNFAKWWQQHQGKHRLKTKRPFSDTQEGQKDSAALPSLSSTYIREWWASSCAASFWTSLWSPVVGMDPEASWQGAPGRPRPVPQSTPSHSQPCPSRLSPQKTRWTVAGPPLLLSFFHVKPPARFSLFLNKGFWILLYFKSKKKKILPCRDAARAVSLRLLMCFNPCTCRGSSASYSNIHELGRYWITWTAPPLFQRREKKRERREGQSHEWEARRRGREGWGEEEEEEKRRQPWQPQHLRPLYAHEAFLNKYPVFVLELNPSESKQIGHACGTANKVLKKMTPKTCKSFLKKWRKKNPVELSRE